MPLIPKPWFNKQTGWWCTDLGGTRSKLARGKDQKKEARAKFHALMQECEVNLHPDAGPRIVSVPSILDEYLDLG